MAASVDGAAAAALSATAVAEARRVAAVRRGDLSTAALGTGRVLSGEGEPDTTGLAGMENYDPDTKKHCYICKQFGHTKVDCPNRLCHHCGGRGHKRGPDCPKYAAEAAEEAAKAKARKRQAQYAQKKARRKEELLWELRQQTGVFGFQKLYALLEIVPNNRLASEATLRKAYHKASLKWHPDRHVNAEPEAKAKAAERFTEVKAAYEVLLEGMATGGAGNGAVSLGGELTAS